jgi:general secretion pathway protein C
MRNVRVVPTTPGARVAGVTLSGLSPRHPLTRIGLRNGDVLRSVGGFELTSPEHALEAYARLRYSDTLPVAIDRAGRAVRITVHVVE